MSKSVKKGRPLKGKQKRVTTTIRIEPCIKRKLTVAGDGNLSEGIDKAGRAYK